MSGLWTASAGTWSASEETCILDPTGRNKSANELTSRILDPTGRNKSANELTSPTKPKMFVLYYVRSTAGVCIRIYDATVTATESIFLVFNNSAWVRVHPKLTIKTTARVSASASHTVARNSLAIRTDGLFYFHQKIYGPQPPPRLDLSRWARSIWNAVNGGTIHINCNVKYSIFL